VFLSPGEKIMVLVKDINLNDCQTGTAVVRGLSRQIIAQMNLIIPNVLVNFEDLNVADTNPNLNLFLQPAAKEALRLAIKDRGGIEIKISSAYRTCAQQFILFRQFKAGNLCGILKAARPGRSNHEDGLAIDVPDFDNWRSALRKYGWQWFGTGDPVHFTYTGGGTRDDIGNIGVKAFQRLWNKNNSSDRITEDGQFGPQTEKRLLRSPVDGFEGMRILMLTQPPMRGEDVRRVQEALIEFGFTLNPDGIFGPATDKAVRKFQMDNDLAVDGIVGPATLRELGIEM
jgi:Putative peptidoglycan binding domain/D-alanyl-D-alanine carboxypeptidase